jgi:tetratricopeptide (TPR) repeat protein
MITAQQNLNRNAEAKRAGEQALVLTDKVLVQRPGYRLALHAAQVIGTVLAGVAENELDPREAVRVGLRDEQVASTLVSLDPNSTVSANNLGVIQQTLGDSYWAQGRLRDALPYYEHMIENFRLAAAGGGGQIILYAYQAQYGISQLAVHGDDATAEAALAAEKPVIGRLNQASGSVLKTMVDGLQDTAGAIIALERDQLPLARDAAVRTVQALQALHPQPGFEDVEDYICQFIAGDAAGRASYLMGEFAAAEKYERVAVEARQKFLTDAVGDRRDLMIKTTWLAMAVARQGRLAEAAQIIAPAVDYQRQLSRHNHGDQWLPIELAQGLYAQALSEPARREALLHEAASLLDSAPAEIRPLHDIRLMRQLVGSALHGKPPSST